MNNYICKHSSGTLTGLGASVIATGVIASLSFAGTPGINVEKAIDLDLNQKKYTILGSSATFGQHGSVFTGQLSSSPESFEFSVAKFYSTLLSAQEPLGAEFEKVLHDNLWDLYES